MSELEVPDIYFFSGSVKDGMLTIGNISAPVYSPDEKIKVPDVLFYDNPQVIAHMQIWKTQLHFYPFHPLKKKKKHRQVNVETSIGVIL